VVVTRVVFLGTPQFAVPTLQALLETDDFEVVAVVTRPDRPAGRGQKVSPPPVKTLAVEHSVPVFQPERLKDSPEVEPFLDQAAPEVMVVAAYGQILPLSFFDSPRFGSLNVHASLLPRYRGAAPVAYAILNGDDETGVTIMKIDEGLDSGGIVAQSVFPIGDNMTAGDLHDVLSREGARLMLETLPLYLRGELAPQPQDETGVTYAPQIRRSQARIDWGRSPQEIHNQIRAFNPWPGAFAGFRDEVVKIWTSRVVGPDEPPLEEPGGPPGTVESWSKQEIVVRCGEGSLLAVREAQMPNRRRHSALDFVNGVGLRVGEVLR
jgi:methionyl-tRNA formyltransferase